VNGADDAQPRMTIRTMTDYLTSAGAHQRYTTIQNMRNRLGRAAFAPYYQDARGAIRRHAAGEDDVFEREIQRLLRSRREAERPYDENKIDANMRVIADYRENFGDTGVEHVGRRFKPLIVQGVRISTEPTLSGSIGTGRRVIPCNIIVDCQAESPTDAEVDYALELLYRGAGRTHETRPAGAQYWHPTSGDSWSLSRASVRRWQDIQDACREIALHWPTVE
jgi:hypothetical protein